MKTIEYLLNKKINFQRYQNGILIKDDNYFFDFQMIDTFAKKINGAKVVIYDNAKNRITKIKLRNTFYDSLMKGHKTPFFKTETFIPGDGIRFWNLYLKEYMGQIFHYQDKNKLLSKNLLYTKANAIKQDLYYDGQHYYLKLFKCRFRAFMKITFSLHIGDYCAYQDICDEDGIYDGETDEYFNVNDVRIMRIDECRDYFLSIFIPRKFCV